MPGCLQLGRGILVLDCRLFTGRYHTCFLAVWPPPGAVNPLCVLKISCVFTLMICLFDVSRVRWNTYFFYSPVFIAGREAHVLSIMIMHAQGIIEEKGKLQSLKIVIGLLFNQNHWEMTIIKQFCPNNYRFRATV